MVTLIKYARIFGIVRTFHVWRMYGGKGIAQSLRMHETAKKLEASLDD